MKLIAVVTAILATKNALADGNETCCFTLNASGADAGPVGQIDDGQTRIGNGTQPGQFCIDNESGGIIDGKNRGCFLTRMFVFPLLPLLSPFYASFSYESTFSAELANSCLHQHQRLSCSVMKAPVLSPGFRLIPMADYIIMDRPIS